MRPTCSAIYVGVIGHIRMKHELWKYGDGLSTFCLAGKHGDDARKNIVEPDAELVWTCDANSHFEAMTKYYEYMGWGEYETDIESYKQTYAEWGWA